MQRHLVGQFYCVLPLLTRSRCVPRLGEGAILAAKATRIGDYDHEQLLTGPLRPRSEIYLQTARSRPGRFHPKTKESAGGIHPRGAFHSGDRNRLPAVQFLFVRKLATGPQCRVMSTQVCEGSEQPDASGRIEMVRRDCSFISESRFSSNRNIPSRTGIAERRSQQSITPPSTRVLFGVQSICRSSSARP